jgi:hypothetical protein
LNIVVKSMYSFDNYGVIEGIVKAGEEIVVKAVLQALRTEEDRK